MEPNQQNIFGITGLQIFIGTIGAYLLSITVFYIYHRLTRPKTRVRTPRPYNRRNRQAFPRYGAISHAPLPLYKKIMNTLPHLSLCTLILGHSVDFLNASFVNDYHANRYENILALNELVYKDDFPTTKKELEEALKKDPECPYLNFLQGKYYLRYIRANIQKLKFIQDRPQYINSARNCINKSFDYYRSFHTYLFPRDIASNLAILNYLKLTYVDTSVIFDESDAEAAIRAKTTDYIGAAIGEYHVNTLFNSTLYILYWNNGGNTENSTLNDFFSPLAEVLHQYARNSLHYRGQVSLPKKQDFDLFNEYSPYVYKSPYSFMADDSKQAILDYMLSKINDTNSDIILRPYDAGKSRYWYDDYMDAVKIKSSLLAYYLLFFTDYAYGLEKRVLPPTTIWNMNDLLRKIVDAKTIDELHPLYLQYCNVIFPEINEKSEILLKGYQRILQHIESRDSKKNRAERDEDQNAKIEMAISKSSRQDILDSELTIFDLLEKSLITEIIYCLRSSYTCLSNDDIRQAMYYSYFFQRTLAEYKQVISGSMYPPLQDATQTEPKMRHIISMQAESNLILANCYQALSQPELAWKRYEEAGAHISVLALETCNYFRESLQKHERARGAELLEQLSERILILESLPPFRFFD